MTWKFRLLQSCLHKPERLAYTAFILLVMPACFGAVCMGVLGTTTSTMTTATTTTPPAAAPASALAVAPAPGPYSCW